MLRRRSRRRLELAIFAGAGNGDGELAGGGGGSEPGGEGATRVRNYLVALPIVFFVKNILIRRLYASYIKI